MVCAAHSIADVPIFSLVGSALCASTPANKVKKEKRIKKIVLIHTKPILNVGIFII